MLHQSHHINRSPDSTGATEVDPLAGAAGGWEAPKFPCLKPDLLVDMEIVEATKGLVKDEKGKSEGRETLTLKLKTTKDYTDKDGKPLRAGFTGFKRIGLTPITGDPTKRDRTMKEVGADLAMVLKCAGMSHREPRELYNDPTIVLKSIVVMKTGIQAARDGFPESNTFNFVPPEK